MYELVELKENDVFTNSKIIAEGTGNQHESVVAIIKKYEADICEFGKLKYFDLKSGKRGQPEKIYFLNEEQATLLMTYMRNNAVVRKFKKNLVSQFYKMRRFLLEKQSKQWQDTRIINKENRIKETDVIKMLADYAKEQGSTHSDKLYVTYTKLANSVIGKKRNEMSITDLNNLTLIESIILQTIEIDMSMNMNYKDIYTDCKNRIEKFADIAYLTA